MGGAGADEGDVCVCVGGGVWWCWCGGGCHVMVVAWVLDGVARGSEGADVLVVVVRWRRGGRWVVRVQTKVMFVSKKICWGGDVRLVHGGKLCVMGWKSEGRPDEGTIV
jgi:hypothetical protein